MAAITQHRRARDLYFDLVRAFPLRPLRSDEELDKAIAVLLKLSAATPETKMDAGERDYVEALAILVQRFEQGRKVSTLPRLSPVERLKFLMEQRGMNVSDVGRIIGSQSSAPLILNGKRAISKAQILKLSQYFTL